MASILIPAFPTINLLVLTKVFHTNKQNILGCTLKYKKIGNYRLHLKFGTH